MPPQPSAPKGPQEGKVPKFRPRLRAIFDPPIPKPRPWLLPLSNLPPPSLAIQPPPLVTPSQISDPPSAYKERTGGKALKLDGNIINYSAKPICLDTKGDIKDFSNSTNQDSPSEQKINALQHKTDNLQLKQFTLEKAKATVLVQEDEIHCIGSESAIKHSVYKRKRSVLGDNSGSSGTKRRIRQKYNFLCQLNDRQLTFDGNINNTDGSQGLPTSVQKLVCVDPTKYGISNLDHAYKGETKDPLHSANQDAPSEQKMDTQQLDFSASPDKDAPSNSDQPSLRNWNSSLAPTAPPPLSKTSTSGFSLCSEESHSSSPKFAFHSQGSESPVQSTITKTNILHETTQESSKFITSSEGFGLPAINNQNAPSDLDVSRLGNWNSPRETIVPSNLSENLAVHDEQNDALDFKLESEESNEDSNVPSLRSWNSPQALIGLPSMFENPSVHDERTTAQECSIDTEESHSPALGFALISHKPPSSSNSDSISMESVARIDAGFENEEIASSGFSYNYEGSQLSYLLSMTTSFSDSPSFESDARFCPFTNSNIIESLSNSLNCLRLI